MENMLLGDRIRKAREKNDLTQEQLALRLGVKKSTIDKWEQETSTPRVNRLTTLAGILNVPLLWLMAGGDRVPEPGPELLSSSELMAHKVQLIRQRVQEVETLLQELELLARDPPPEAGATG
ncbi:MAG: helix-turn-helix transcriptional regulator [Thiothrix sp.]|nr:helix-turn-helix transcriptional regulator [Thiothrix sp.]HPQ96499.1 helix-turn-helix transcriptional regulator [Thiolinea sp.]